MPEKSYCVYKHSFPNGKVYIGITSQKPEDRWNHGFGYECNREMFRDIVLYGWNNVQHDIIQSNVDENTARSIERDMIKELSAGGKRTAYNTQQVCPEKHKEWYETEINEDSCKRFKNKFLYLNDTWIDYYSESGMIFDCSIEPDSVVVRLMPEIKENNVVAARTLEFLLPYKGITFDEANRWLLSKPTPNVRYDYLVNADWVKGQQEPILKEGE